MKQLSFIAHEDDAGAKKYTRAAGTPIYTPKDRKPHILELVDGTRTRRLQLAIEASGVSEQEKLFLYAAASRHTVFNYELIADYYAHASPEMRKLMEDSALVIIDVKRAIELGYVRLCETIKRLHMEQLAEQDGPDHAQAELAGDDLGAAEDPTP